MRTSLMLAGALLLPAAMPTRAQPPEGVTTPGRAPDQTATHGSIRIEGSIDLDGLAANPARAAEVLSLFESMAAQAPEGSADRAGFDGIRAYALAVLGRRDEAGAIIDRIAAGGVAEPAAYLRAWGAAARMRDPARLLALIEAATRSVPESKRADLHAIFDGAVVWDLAGFLDTMADQRPRRRMYQALVLLGWPGDGEAETRDNLRLRLADLRLASGDRVAAAALARRISAPGQVLRLLTLRRYDGLLEEPVNAPERLHAAIAEGDRLTARALAEHPANRHAISRRAQFLLSVGRAEEQLALLAPYLGDVRATVDFDPDGHWLIDLATHALLMLGRTEEGTQLYARLAAVPIEVRPNLLDVQINYAGYLWQAGRHGEALAQAVRLTRDYDARMNDYGRLWAWSSRVCALAGLGRAVEARPWLERMRPLRAANQGALMRAYLCVGDMAAAEAMMIERLGSAPAEAVLALQHYRVAEAPDGPAAAIEARLAELRARPAVVAALGRAGRTLSLPVARSYWGSF